MEELNLHLTALALRPASDSTAAAVEIALSKHLQEETHFIVILKRRFFWLIQFAR